MAPRLIARSFAFPPARWGASAPAREPETDRDLARNTEIARGIRFEPDRCHSSRVKGAVARATTSKDPLAELTVSATSSSGKRSKPWKAIERRTISGSGGG